MISFGKKKYYTAVVFEKHENFDVDYELKEISYLKKGIFKDYCDTKIYFVFLSKAFMIY